MFLARTLVSSALFLSASLLLSCSTTSHYSYTPILEEDHESARKIIWSGNAVVELSDDKYRLFVYGYPSGIKMSLAIPANEELFVHEPTLRLTEPEKGEVISEYQTSWYLDKGLDVEKGSITKASPTEYLDLAAAARSRLVGSAETPAATIYYAFTIIPDDNLNTYLVSWPVFKNKNGEIINFEGVLFEKARSVKVEELYWLDVLGILAEIGQGRR